MKQTIVLYNPKAVFFDMPLALLAIGTQVCDDYEVVIIDGRIEPNPEERLRQCVNNAVLVGVTSLTGAPLKDAIEFTKNVRKLRSDVPIVWGGWHTSLFPKQVLKDVPEVDIAVQGQGEETFKELVTYLAAGQGVESVKGITYRTKTGAIEQTSARAMVNMNDLPRLNYDLIDVEAYFSAKGNRQFDFITSIGCFFRCTFCADPFVFNRKYNGLLPQRIADDLAFYHQKYNFTDVNFQDETFFTYPKRVVEMADLFDAMGTPFSWAATMRADSGSRMSMEDFRKCQLGGLRRLLVGVESGSQEMMDWLKKDIKLEQVFLCAERCKELGISVIFPFIVGFPDESDKSIISTKKVISQLAMMSPLFDTPIFYFKPYPGTKITDDVVQRGAYTLPSTIEEWSAFDYIGSRGPWVSPEKYKEFERYKFYLKVMRQRSKLLAPLRWVSKQRVSRQQFAFPIEKLIIERLKKKQQLS